MTHSQVVESPHLKSREEIILEASPRQGLQARVLSPVILPLPSQGHPRPPRTGLIRPRLHRFLKVVTNLLASPPTPVSQSQAGQSDRATWAGKAAFPPGSPWTHVYLPGKNLKESYRVLTSPALKVSSRTLGLDATGSMASFPQKPATLIEHL